MIRHADHRQCHALVMTINPVAIIIMCAWKADHFPRHQVPVAAVDWIGKKTGLGVGENELEESLTVEAVELQGTVFEAFNGLVFLRIAEIDKGVIAEFGAAGRVERGNCFTIMLSGSDRRLRA